MIARLWKPDPKGDALREANLVLCRRRQRAPAVDPFLVACLVLFLLAAAYALRM